MTDRVPVATLAFLGSLLGVLQIVASAEGLVGDTPRGYVPVATILASPDQYEGKEVVIGGVVVEQTRAIFPNGRPYYTLTVRDGQTAITVFSWERSLFGPGDRIEVQGMFHTWRYNLHHVIESHRIIRSGSPTGSLGIARVGAPADEVPPPRG